MKGSVIEQMSKADVNGTNGINQIAGVLLEATAEKEDVSLTSQVSQKLLGEHDQFFGIRATSIFGIIVLVLFSPNRFRW